MNVTLHIERLVLDGVSATDTPRLRRAVEQELTRLLRHGGIAPHLAGGGATPKLAAPQIRFAAGQSTSGMGRQIARAVYGGIGKSG
ncbi:MAG TPA: hypothetical protein VGG48_09140 [Rhizomicrobium sp.]|jgi:hypothetical protein